MSGGGRVKAGMGSEGPGGLLSARYGGGRLGGRPESLRLGEGDGKLIRQNTWVTAVLSKRKGLTQGRWAEPSAERTLHTRAALKRASCTRGSLAVQRREKCLAPGLQRLPPLGALVMGHLLETRHRLGGFRSVTRVLRPSGTLVPVRSPDLSGRVFIVTAKDPIIESIGYK